jgi:hypothetical protein
MEMRMRSLLQKPWLASGNPLKATSMWPKVAEERGDGPLLERCPPLRSAMLTLIVRVKNQFK